MLNVRLRVKLRKTSAAMVSSCCAETASARCTEDKKISGCGGSSDTKKRHDRNCQAQLRLNEAVGIFRN